ncbi:MAG: zinc-ribbon domain-containing protein [Gemmatimonadota bacterium]|nr:zinc-ribbon domain-containing protein [Gemmatimonadota bacterium]
MSANASGPFCPECRKPATGNFCQSCGAKLGGRFCSQCGAKLGPSAAFCSQCGAKNDVAGPTHKAAAAAVVSGQNLPWWIAGAAMFALIVAIGVSMVQPGPAQPPTAGSSEAPTAAPGQGGAGNVDLSSMTPREAADRLFNRVMTSVEQGDTAAAQAFVPMAVGAYERAMPLDHDGLFHLSLLQYTAQDLEGALESALAILEEDPNHLLGLSAAARAARDLGRTDEAQEHYERILEVYPEESQRSLSEYELHARIMTTVQDSAEAFLQGR